MAVLPAADAVTVELFKVAREGGYVMWFDHNGIAGINFLTARVKSVIAFFPNTLLMPIPNFNAALAVHSTDLKFLAIVNAILFASGE